MMKQIAIEELGKPNLIVAGFQLWVHALVNLGDGREWVCATAQCESSGASVRTDSPIVLVRFIKAFGERCDALRRREVKDASLGSLEPHFFLKIQVADSLGHLDLEIKISPDHTTQSHNFKFEIDLIDLSVLVEQCEAILQKFPVRNPGLFGEI